jgi:hypothetical protein
MQTTSDIKNLTNVNIGIFQKIEDCEGGVILYAGSSFIRVNTIYMYVDLSVWNLFTDINVLSNKIEVYVWK